MPGARRRRVPVSPDLGVSRDLRGAVLVASATAVSLIAFQMGAKATRDALFLSHYDVTALPAMVIASAAISLGLAFAAARWMTALGPGRLVPGAFLLSAILLAAEWRLAVLWPGPTAVLLYLHYGALGALLVSGFWSLVNERFDPRTAKRQIGRIASGGTVGGLLGGLLAERVAVYLSIEAMLPILAVLQLICAALTWQLRPGDGRHGGRVIQLADPGEAESGLAILARSPYLQTVVTLVFVTTVTEGLVDWVFKERATAAVGRGEDLLRLFAVFYTGVALVTVVVQAVASRAALQRLGLARTVAALPGVVAVGSVGALLVPGLASAAAVRGADSVMRHGLYRPAYELLFTPLPPRRKRPTKALVDVAVVRLGDIGGGALVQALLLVAAAAAGGVLLAVAVALSLLGIVLAVRLHRGYVHSLERSLVARADQLDPESDAGEMTQTALLQSTTMLHLSAAGLSLPDTADEEGERGEEMEEAGGSPEEPAVTVDPALQRIAELRSGDPDRVRRALRAGALPAETVPYVIRLLAWDPVMPDAMRALRGVAGRVTGQLVDHLLDPEEEFTVRRRIPLVLAAVPTRRAFAGLFRGLEDRRFEVRYRCGRALLRLREREGALAADRAEVVAAILREVAVDRGVWESHHLLDRPEPEEDGADAMADAAVRQRAGRSLEHVFNLLALIMPREPLRVAFRALYADDAQLRGTALEYLDTALPSRVREQLWPFLEEEPGRPRPRRPTDEVLRELMRSSESPAVDRPRQEGRDFRST